MPSSLFQAKHSVIPSSESFKTDTKQQCSPNREVRRDNLKTTIRALLGEKVGYYPSISLNMQQREMLHRENVKKKI